MDEFRMRRKVNIIVRIKGDGGKVYSEGRHGGKRELRGWRKEKKKD